MDAADGGKESAPSGEELVPRAPEERDLVALCRTLNQLGAKYIIIGGFAAIYAGHGRLTEDVDLLIETSPSNEALVYKALKSLPDQAVNQLEPGDVEKFTVVRVADEIVVDLMKSASGIDYAGAVNDVVVRTVGGVAIPFASHRLLWRMKSRTHRAKDAPDLVFLQEVFAARGEKLPEA